MKSISDLYEVSRICTGISHPVRAKIMELLENNGKIPLHEIDKKLRGTEFEKSYNTIQGHVKKMESCGLVEILKNDKDITIVVLKKKIEIIAEDV
jgi:DNA-binding transcriptional ArsR family regulator